MNINSTNDKQHVNRSLPPSLRMLDDRYRLTQHVQISAVFLDLAWLGCEVRIRTLDKYEIASTLLKVDPANGTFIFDGCRTDAERDLLLASDEIVFSTTLRGVEIDFTVGRPYPVKYRGEPACAAAFPSQLYHFERRSHPRASALVNMAYNCELRTSDERILTLDIADLSLSGVGLRSKAVSAGQLSVGTILKKCSLDFGDLGKLEVDLQVVGQGLVQHGRRDMHHIGCAFVSLAPGQQTFLQRMVYQIELAGRE
ncbi:flagellar brake protein [Cupriavidus sp. 2TAF22]|uniref:flagellar brake protein n=1 Tax=unclassified Cupriavidus TaxID=2640874 RepID=UPI003F921B70